jgi:O-antigen/teichoic acid export membrane protein
LIFSKKLAVRSGFVVQEAVNFGMKPLFTSLISLFVIRWFSLELWGSFVFYLVFIQLSITFLSWGQKPHLTKLFAAQPGKIGSTWGTSFAARLPLVLIVMCCILVFSKLQFYAIPLILWVTFKWLAVMLESLIQFNRDYITAIKAELLSLAGSSLLFYFWLEEFDLELLIYIFFISNAIKCVALIPILLKNKVSILPLKGWKTELLASLPFFALTLAGMLQTKGDLYLATFLMEEAELGKYQVLVGFLLLGQAFSGIVLGPFLKNIFRLKNNEISKFKKRYLMVGLIVSALFSIALFLLMHYVYQIDLQIQTAFLCFAYLAPLYFFTIETQLLVKHQKEKMLLNFTLAATIVNVTLSVIFIPIIGITGALLSGFLGKVTLAALVLQKTNKIQNVGIS